MDNNDLIILGEIFLIYPTNEFVDIFSKLLPDTQNFVHLPEI